MALVQRLNEALKDRPVPDGSPAPDLHVLEVARKTLPLFEIVSVGETANPDPEQWPKWLRWALKG
jgi:hypothetical protein